MGLSTDDNRVKGLLLWKSDTVRLINSGVVPPLLREQLKETLLEIRLELAAINFEPSVNSHGE